MEACCPIRTEPSGSVVSTARGEAVSPMRISTIAYMNGTGGSARASHAMGAFRSPAGLASPAGSFQNGWLPLRNDHVVCTKEKTGTTARRLGEASP